MKINQIVVHDLEETPVSIGSFSEVNKNSGMLHIQASTASPSPRRVRFFCLENAIPINTKQLMQILPSAGQVAGVFVPVLNTVMNRYQIVGSKRVAAFIAQTLLGHRLSLVLEAACLAVTYHELNAKGSCGMTLDPNELLSIFGAQGRDPLNILLVNQIDLYEIPKAERILLAVGDTWVINDGFGWSIGADAPVTETKFFNC